MNELNDDDDDDVISLAIMKMKAMNKETTMMNDFANSQVTIEKKELLKAIRENLMTHENDYKEARAGFEAQFLREAEKLFGRAKEGKFDVYAIGLSPPENHAKDYSRVIRMLEMSTAKEITITEKQFSQFVLDDWSWKESFTRTSSIYKASL